MKRILVTNDDGYKSAGFLALVEELQKEFDVVPVAPATEKSWIGKSLSARNKVRVKKVNWHHTEIFAVEGTPADCVQIGIYHLLSQRPDLVVSGINIGANIGRARILSSGTVGAAMEASIDGVKALASSLSIPMESQKNVDFTDEKYMPLFKNAAKITAKAATMMLKSKNNKELELLSLNIPFNAHEHAEIEVTAPFHESSGQIFHKKGMHFTNSRPPITIKTYKKGTDLHAIRNGNISLTPLSLKLVTGNALAQLRKNVQKEWGKA